MTHQEQPSASSCGPTCVAMIVGTPARAVINRLAAVRSKPRRKLQRTHGTNPAEIGRLLALYGFELGMREPIGALTGDEFGLLRVHRPRASGGYRGGWHWTVVADGNVFDPALTAEHDVHIWNAETQDHRIYFYAVTPKGSTK